MVAENLAMLNTWRYRFYFVITSALLLLALLFFVYRGPIYDRLPGRNTPVNLSHQSIPEADPPGIYDWDPTVSAFDPVHIPAAGLHLVDDLCTSFPVHLLDQIQPVLKTGHGVLDVRMDPQLQGVSACLENLLLFSDLDEEFEGRQLHDVIRVIPAELAASTSQLQAWHKLKAAAANGTLDTFVPGSRDGWKTDKFKFLASVSHAWHLRPERAWYVFYEADTYIFWDNLFRLLVGDGHFHPDEPLYFGSPSPGREGTWFANGGPGFILSRAAMRRLVAKDRDPTTGAYLGSKLTEDEWDNLTDDCCGDSVVGWALAKRGVALSGLFPLFNPHAPHSVPFSERYWCQPVMTMHKPLEEDVMALWRWEFEAREANHPLLYRDLALDHHKLATRPPSADWDNGGLDTFPPPPHPNLDFLHDPHASPDACASACATLNSCFQWRYHQRACAFTRVMRLGRAREPEAEPPLFGADGPGGGKNGEGQWDAEDLRFHSGWNGPRIARWAMDHTCSVPRWVRPSVKRIY